MAQSILPNVDVTVLDGALGLASGTRDGVCAQIGESSQGDNLAHPVSDAGQVAELFGTGALADAIRDALGAGARLVLARRLPAATPGEVESVVHEVAGYYCGVTPGAGNTSTLDSGVSAAGTLVEAVTFLLKITTGGILAEAAFAYSTDGGATWSDPLAMNVAGPLVIGENSVMVNWSTGTYVVDDTWNVGVMQGDGAVTVSGSPTLGGIVQVVIDGEGGRNAGTFRLLDGDDAEILGTTTIPLSGQYEVVGTGITLEFSDGYYAVGDTWEITLTPPGTTLDQIAEAALSIRNYPTTPEVIHVVGPTSAATWAALHALAEEFATEGKFPHVLCEAALPEDEESDAEWIANLADEVESAGSLRRVSVYAGWIEDDDDERSGAARYLGHLMARQKVSHSPGRVIDGPVRGVTEFGPADEGYIAALDALGFTTMRRYDGLGGVYITNGRMLVDDTSDFRWVEWRRVMDKACREVRLAAIRYLHFGMDDEGLRALQVQCQAALNRMIAAGECAAGGVEIPEDQDIIGTSTVRVKVRVQPIPTARWLDVEIAFAAQV